MLRDTFSKLISSKLRFINKNVYNYIGGTNQIITDVKRENFEVIQQYKECN